jgi:hypothetical protein
LFLKACPFVQRAALYQCHQKLPVCLLRYNQLRDAVKSGGIKDDEISGRIGESYDYIIDSKAALIGCERRDSQRKKSIEFAQQGCKRAFGWWCELGEKGQTASMTAHYVQPVGYSGPQISDQAIS